MKTAAALALLLLTCCVSAYGQTSHKGLTPGRSTRTDVERVLGQPVRSVSKSLIEYKAPEDAGKLFVQYRDDAPAGVVERIELTCFTGRSDSRTAYDRCVSALNREQVPGVLEDARSLTPKPERQGYDLFRYYGAPRFMVLRHIAKGIDVEVRLAFYSKELYEGVAPEGGCTGTIFGTWQTERGRMTIARSGDNGIQGAYAKDNGSFSLKQVSGGYMGEWKDDTGSGTMALMLDNNSFTASLSRGAAATVSGSQSTTRAGDGAKLGSLIDTLKKSGSGVAVGTIIDEPSEPRLSRITGLPPGEPLTGKCVP